MARSGMHRWYAGPSRQSAAAVGGALLALIGASSAGFAQTTTPATPGVNVAQSGGTGTPAPLPTAAPAAMMEIPPMQSAADLRVALDSLLEEHTYLAGQAIGPVIAGQAPQAAAAASVLDANTQELGNLIGSLYGQDTQSSFVQLWRRHLSDYVQYAQAGLSGDTTGQQQARQDLMQFAQDTDALLSGVNPDLPAGTLASGLTMHVQGTLQVIDALEAKDFASAYTLGKNGADMTGMLGDPLATAIAQQFPDRFPPEPCSRAEARG